MLENFEPKKHTYTCKVVQILNRLEQKDRDVLTAALADHDKWSNRALSNALVARGIDVSTETIRSHRTNVCPCRKAN